MDREDTPPPEYTTISTVTVPLIHQVLQSPSPSPERQIFAPVPLPAQPTPMRTRKRMGRPPKNAVPPPDSSALFELLIQVTLPDKRVRQRGGKTKSEKQEPIKRGPLEIDISIGWVELMEMVAELIQVAPASLVVETFEWHWLKPASGAWLPLTDERGLASLIKQVLTKAEPYVILRMHPPRAESAPLVSSAL